MVLELLELSQLIQLDLVLQLLRPKSRNHVQNCWGTIRKNMNMQ